MNAPDDLSSLSNEQLQEVVRQMRTELLFKQAYIDKLTHENAIIKRLKFAAKSEAFTAEQRSLLDETCDEDLAALARDRAGSIQEARGREAAAQARAAAGAPASPRSSA